MDLEIGKIYLVHCGYFSMIGEEYYEALQSLVYTHTTNRMDDGLRYYFHNPITEYRESVDSWSLRNSVFTTDQQFLRYSLNESIRTNTPMNNFFKGKINESKSKEPELWL